ncbi:hypothetical protein JHK82_015898 [Glycine max]|nr:hypothetical protein JHK82_015898 [Glycine max]
MIFFNLMFMITLTGTSSFPFNSPTHFSLTFKCNSSFNCFRTAPELWFNTILSRDNHGTRNSATYSVVTKQLDVKELEMLLEAYFVQIYGTLNKLSTLLLEELCIEDRQGLLAEVMRTFRENGLNVTRAEISIIGNMASNAPLTWASLQRLSKASTVFDPPVRIGSKGGGIEKAIIPSN